MPRAGGPATQVTQAGGFEAVESLDGKTLYFAHARVELGLWSMPSAGGAAQPMAELKSTVQGRWGVTQDGVCYMEPPPAAEKAIVCWNSSTGKSSRRGVVDKPFFGNAPGFSVSRDGRRILWSQTDNQDADLVLVENFR